MTTPLPICPPTLVGMFPILSPTTACGTEAPEAPSQLPPSWEATIVIPWALVCCILYFGAATQFAFFYSFEEKQGTLNLDVLWLLFLISFSVE